MKRLFYTSILLSIGLLLGIIMKLQHKQANPETIRKLYSYQNTFLSLFIDNQNSLRRYKYSHTSKLRYEMNHCTNELREVVDNFSTQTYPLMEKRQSAKAINSILKYYQESLLAMDSIWILAMDKMPKELVCSINTELSPKPTFDEIAIELIRNGKKKEQVAFVFLLEYHLKCKEFDILKKIDELLAAAYGEPQKEVAYRVAYNTLFTNLNTLDSLHFVVDVVNKLDILKGELIINKDTIEVNQSNIWLYEKVLNKSGKAEVPIQLNVKNDLTGKIMKTKLNMNWWVMPAKTTN